MNKPKAHQQFVFSRSDRSRSLKPVSDGKTDTHLSPGGRVEKLIDERKLKQLSDSLSDFEFDGGECE